MSRFAPRRSASKPHRPTTLGPAWSGYRGEKGDERRNGWEIVIAGELNDDQRDLHQKLADVGRNSSGIIYFDSCGGNAYIGLALATLIRLRGLKATGVVVGECSSAALLPFAACRERYVTPHSALLFHAVRWQSGEHVRVDEAIEWARHFQFMEADQDQLLSRLFGCPIELIREWTAPGRFVVGKDLAAAGLAQMLDLTGGTLWEQMRELKSSR